MNDATSHQLILNDQEIRSLLEVIRKSITDEELIAFKSDLLFIKLSIDEILLEQREATT
jgi:hypothetical protein|tara:strand:+ start:2346 stop:2522 length:177 start_codon:yes stop_codon:yes gene_type:complete